jgi:hypothetical protein
MEYWKDAFAQFGFKFSASESMNLRSASTMKAEHFRRSGLFFKNQNI